MTVRASAMSRERPEARPYVYRGRSRDAGGVDLVAVNAAILAGRSGREGVTPGSGFEWGGPMMRKPPRKRGTRPKTAKPKDQP